MIQGPRLCGRGLSMFSDRHCPHPQQMATCSSQVIARVWSRGAERISLSQRKEPQDGDLLALPLHTYSSVTTEDRAVVCCDWLGGGLTCPEGGVASPPTPAGSTWLHTCPVTLTQV